MIYNHIYMNNYHHIDIFHLDIQHHSHILQLNQKKKIIINHVQDFTYFYIDMILASFVFLLVNMNDGISVSVLYIYIHVNRSPPVNFTGVKIFLLNSTPLNDARDVYLTSPLVFFFISNWYISWTMKWSVCSSASEIFNMNRIEYLTKEESCILVF